MKLKAEANKPWINDFANIMVSNKCNSSLDLNLCCTVYTMTRLTIKELRLNRKLF